jgi:hypothetical protein
MKLHNMPSALEEIDLKVDIISFSAIKANAIKKCIEFHIDTILEFEYCEDNLNSCKFFHNDWFK